MEDDWRLSRDTNIRLSRNTVKAHTNHEGFDMYLVQLGDLPVERGGVFRDFPRTPYSWDGDERETLAPGGAGVRKLDEGDYELWVIYNG